MMQSLVKQDEVKEIVKDYGMVIVDECHHVSAFTFEQILKTIQAKYVYGLTATPLRQDGHHPIVFMQCGPIRHVVDARKQAAKRPFNHYLIPRFTSFRKPFTNDEKDISFSDLYMKLGESDIRNQQIVHDITQSVAQGRNPLVLTQRTAHVQTLAKALESKVPLVLTLTGSMPEQDKWNTLEVISNLPPGKNLVLIATGKYIGEGFDEPRLDTLFLAMPIAWQGILQQYAGRLHRLHETKQEVQIYDYIDTHVGVLDRMYLKRLKGYASMGYSIKAEQQVPETINNLYTNTSFLTFFSKDITAINKEIILVSPYITQKWLISMLEILKTAMLNGVIATIITRPHSDYQEKDHLRISKSLAIIRQSNINLMLKPNIHQKFAVLDQKIVWYGSVDLLSYGTTEASIMRLDSPEIAHELLADID